MEPRVSLITLGVRDLQRSMRFYRDGLGWPLSSASVEGEVAFFKSGGAILALWSRAALATDAGLPLEASGFGGVALAHNVANRELVDEALREAAAAGGIITRPAQETDWGGYNGYFADPDGFLWEIAWNPGWPLAADGSVQLPA
ncbi:MAG TPA: VOC family protein [Chloroflexota bacterium]|nr:VOC family protein [Chloroflexota bacterium]